MIFSKYDISRGYEKTKQILPQHERVLHIDPESAVLTPRNLGA